MSTNSGVLLQEGTGKTYIKLKNEPFFARALVYAMADDVELTLAYGSCVTHYKFISMLVARDVLLHTPMSFWVTSSLATFVITTKLTGMRLQRLLQLFYAVLIAGSNRL